MASRTNRFKFTNKVHSRLAMVAVIFGVLSLAGMFIGIIFAYRSGGDVSKAIAAAAVFLLLLDAVGIALAVRARADENVFRLLPNAALILDILVLALWVGVYLTGILLA